MKSLDSNVSNLYTSMAAMHSIKIDVEVIKARIQSTDEIMRRMESQIQSTNDAMRRIERRDQRVPIPPR